MDQLDSHKSKIFRIEASPHQNVRITAHSDLPRAVTDIAEELIRSSYRPEKLEYPRQRLLLELWQEGELLGRYKHKESLHRLSETEKIAHFIREAGIDKIEIGYWRLVLKNSNELHSLVTSNNHSTIELKDAIKGLGPVTK